MYLLINNKNLEIKKAISFKERLYGLMGKKNINYGMLFDKCNSIHTFFMKENIDIIGLNQNNTVIYKYENLGKNRIIVIHNEISNTKVLELPQGYAKFINMNDTLVLK